MGGKNRLIYLPQRSMFLFLLWQGPEWSLFGSDDPTTYLLDERGCACKRLVGRLDCNYIRVWMPRDFLVGMMERKCVHVFGSGLHIKWKEKKNNTCIWYPTSRPRSCGYPLHACLLCSMPLATGHLLEFWIFTLPLRRHGKTLSEMSSPRRRPLCGTRYCNFPKKRSIITGGGAFSSTRLDTATRDDNSRNPGYLRHWKIAFSFRNGADSGVG